MGLSTAQAEVLGRICESHGEEDVAGLQETLPVDRYTAHPRIVGACLRLADALDVTADRAPEIVYRCLKLDETPSSDFWQAHFHVNGVSEENGTFMFSAYFFDLRGRDLLNQLADGIDRELSIASGTLAALGVRLSPSLDRAVTEVPLSYLKCSFTQQAQVENLVDIIVESIYPRHDVAIRELIQNSIDAYKLNRRLHPYVRDERSMMVGELRAGNEKYFFIQDNGIGMSAYIVRELLGVAGRRYQHLREIREAIEKIRESAPDFDLIAQFGIGFFSCFHISSEIHLASFREEYQPFQVVIRSRVGEFPFEKGRLRKPGTIVLLKLNDLGRGLDLRNALRYYLVARPEDVDKVEWCFFERHSITELEAVLSVLLGGGEGISWDCREAVEFSEAYGRFRKDLLPYQARDLVKFSPPPGKATGFVAKSRGTEGGLILAQEGIFIGDQIPGYENLMIAKIGLNFPAGWLSLAASRTQLKEGNKALELRKWLVEIRRRFLADLSQTDDEVLKELWEQLIEAEKEASVSHIDQVESASVEIIAERADTVLLKSLKTLKTLKTLAECKEDIIFLCRVEERYVSLFGYFSTARLYRDKNYDEMTLGELLAAKGCVVVINNVWEKKGKIYDNENLVRQCLEPHRKTIRRPAKTDVLNRVVSLSVPKCCEAMKVQCRFLRLGSSCSRVVGVADEAWFNVDHQEIEELYKRLNAVEKIPPTVLLIFRIWVELVSFRFKSAAEMCEGFVLEQLRSGSG